MRNCHSAWGDEVSWVSKGCLSDICAEVIAEVRAVGQVKYLENRLKIGSFPNPEVFGYPGIELEEGLST